MRARSVCLVGAALLADACATTPRAIPAPGTPPIPDLLQLGELRTHNRAAERVFDDGTIIVRLDEREGYGVAWVEGITLRGGTIVVEIRGQDVPQRSFVGVAFHGANDTTYDAVFFRPFHFRAEDPVSRARAVQYVSHPVHTWRYLREHHPGVYESGVADPPDPDGWFTVRLELEPPRVRVFVDDAEVPALEVTQVAAPRGTRIGLWVGNPSGGDFRNLRVYPE